MRHGTRQPACERARHRARYSATCPLFRRPAAGSVCAVATSIWFKEVRRHAATDAAHVYGGLAAGLRL